MATYGGAKSGGILIPRSATSPYLLSGILKCGVCSANLIVVSGSGSYGHHPKFGCSPHFNRGTYSDAVTVRRDWLEGRLLDELQNQVLKRETNDWPLADISKMRRITTASLSLIISCFAVVSSTETES
jgi:Recombinase zinc beta ribbon domain